MIINRACGFLVRLMNVSRHLDRFEISMFFLARVFLKSFFWPGYFFRSGLGEWLEVLQAAPRHSARSMRHAATNPNHYSFHVI